MEILLVSREGTYETPFIFSKSTVIAPTNKWCQIGAFILRRRRRFKLRLLFLHICPAFRTYQFSPPPPFAIARLWEIELKWARGREIFGMAAEEEEDNFLMQRLSYLTETMLFRNITRNRIVLSVKDCPCKPLRRRPKEGRRKRRRRRGICRDYSASAIDHKKRKSPAHPLPCRRRKFQSGIGVASFHPEFMSLHMKMNWFT